MARLGDTTDHGGKVSEASPDLSHMGIRVALNGHLVLCLKCKRPFLIIAGGAQTATAQASRTSPTVDRMPRDFDARVIRTRYLFPVFDVQFASITHA